MAQYTSPKTKAQIIALKKLKYSDWAIVQLLQPQTKVSHATLGVEYQQQQILDGSTSLPLGPLPSAATSESWVYSCTNAAKYPCSLIGIEKPVARGPTVDYSGHNHAGTTLSSWTKSKSSYLGLTAANITGGNLTISHGGRGIFIWGYITQEGVGQLYLIQRKLNALGYIEILGDAFFGTLANYKITAFDITFQHNQDPKHTARLTQHWLASWGVSVLPWLSKSLDLNIIENVWWHLKERVRTHQPPALNKEELWKIVRDEWKQISPKYIGNLYDSLLRRVQAVYLAKGGNTKY
ncbi:Transposable element Tcb2 transposase [Rhizoctonia solani]|uniref:Transposable element Tcb2 transposase n=1 Tax=Rhizoctonia solani TaxID=456999 RepID=A0A8H8SYZ1_9AGAM|nr:Transposable element Tcb2 transposase [Rhizoctonia solani]QRW21853.1 Transposable element Tcb2 transposase [Rhizoctonia solani]